MPEPQTQGQIRLRRALESIGPTLRNWWQHPWRPALLAIGTIVLTAGGLPILVGLIQKSDVYLAYERTKPVDAWLAWIKWLCTGTTPVLVPLIFGLIAWLGYLLVRNGKLRARLRNSPKVDSGEIISLKEAVVAARAKIAEYKAKEVQKPADPMTQQSKMIVRHLALKGRTTVGHLAAALRTGEGGLHADLKLLQLELLYVTPRNVDSTGREWFELTPTGKAWAEKEGIPITEQDSAQAEALATEKLVETEKELKRANMAKDAEAMQNENLKTKVKSLEEQVFEYETRSAGASGLFPPEGSKMRELLLRREAKGGETLTPPPSPPPYETPDT